MNYLISGSKEGVARFDAAALEASARARWADAVDYVGTRDNGTFTIQICPQGEPFFAIRLLPPGDAISTDGTEEQVAAVAVLARRLLPVEVPGELWLYDQAFTAHKTLEPVTLQESSVWQGWVEH